MDPLTTRVLARHLKAKSREVPVRNRDLDRVVWVLPETLKEHSSEYEKVNPRDLERPSRRGKPTLPHKPKKPRPSRVHKDPIPSPVKPPIPDPLPKPPIPVKRVKLVKPPKVPEAPTKRKWLVDPPEPRDLVARVVARARTRPASPGTPGPSQP